MTDRSSGGRPPSVTNEEITNAIREAEHPTLTTSEVAERLDLTRRGLLDRLKELMEEGAVQGRTIGDESKVWLWWDESVASRQNWPSEKDEFTIGRKVIDELDLPGSGNRLKKRRRAVNIVFKYLFAKDEVVPSDLKLLAWIVDSDTYANRDSLWQNCLLTALDSIAFFRSTDENKRGLSADGTVLKAAEEKSSQGLWVAWENRKEVWQQKVHEEFWDDFRSVAEQITIEEFDTSRVQYPDGFGNQSICTYSFEEGMIQSQIELGHPPVHKNRGSLSCSLIVPNRLRELSLWDIQSHIEREIGIAVTTEVDRDTGEYRVIITDDATLHLSHDWESEQISMVRTMNWLLKAVRNW